MARTIVDYRTIYSAERTVHMAWLECLVVAATNPRLFSRFVLIPLYPFGRLLERGFSKRLAKKACREEFQK